MENWKQSSGAIVSEEERKATIQSLLKERYGYEVRGLKDRVAQVDAQLRRFGYEAAAPAKRAERRPQQGRQLESR